MVWGVSRVALGALAVTASVTQADAHFSTPGNRNNLMRSFPSKSDSNPFLKKKKKESASLDQALQSLSAGFSSTLTSIITYPFNPILSQSMSQMRVPRILEDGTYRGGTANTLRVFIKWTSLDFTNRNIESAFRKLSRFLGLEDKHAERLVAIASPLASVVVVTAMLCPLERVRQYQILHGGSMRSAAKYLVKEEGLRACWRGTTRGIISTLPSFLLLATSEREAKGDKVLARKIAQRRSLFISPLTTYLFAVKQTQQTLGVGVGKAYLMTLQRVRQQPAALLSIILLGQAYTQANALVYYPTRGFLSNQVPKINGFIQRTLEAEALPLL